MILINQSAKQLNLGLCPGIESQKACEYAGRNCYASQDKITDDSCYSFVQHLIDRHHGSPLEFADLTFDITTSRAVQAEITRHRLASFCVESQRYIQEAKTGDITFIKPTWYEVSNQISVADSQWQDSMQQAEHCYKQLISAGMQPQQAREVQPNSTACRIIMKANQREWLHIFSLRCSKAAYPQMRELAINMLCLAHEAVPVVFDELYQTFAQERESSYEYDKPTNQ